MRVLGLVVVLLPVVANAQELAAVCSYDYSINDAGQRSATSGGFSMKAAYMLPVGKPLNVQVRTTKAPCFDFLATGDDMMIQGGCVRMIDGGKLKLFHRFTFDRVSGSFEESVSYNDKSGLVHYGRCNPAKPVF